MKKSIAWTLGLTLLLSACSGGAGKSESGTQLAGATITGDIRAIGWFNIESEAFYAPEAVTYTSTDALFQRYQDPLPPTLLAAMDTISAPAAEAACIVYDRFGALFTGNPEKIDAANEYWAFYGSDPVFDDDISAGDVLLIQTPDGQWPDLVRNPEIFDGYATHLNNSIAGSIGTGSTLHIPGDDFPAFTGVTLPTVQAVRNLMVAVNAQNTPTAGTVVTWDAKAYGDNTFFTLSIRGDSKIMDCAVADTGSFSLPAEVADLGFIDSIQGEREVVSAVQNGEALLMISTYSLEQWNH